MVYYPWVITMPKTYHVTAEEAQTLRQTMKSCKKDVGAYRRMEAVALRGEGKKNEEIGTLTGFHPDWVSKLVSNFRNQGIDALLEDGRIGGNHQNLSTEQEAEILKDFIEAANAGQMVSISAIKAKYDEAISRETAPTHIYAVLKRHGWRKVMPRSKHPKKASGEEVEASKKLRVP